MRLLHGHWKGGKRSRTYNSWRAMMTRCYRESHQMYGYYGGEGVKVCKRWHKFKNFLEDMGERPEGMTLDRIDGSKDYCPSNCKWSTVEEQNRNRTFRKRTVSQPEEEPAF